MQAVTSDSTLISPWMVSEDVLNNNEKKSKCNNNNNICAISNGFIDGDATDRNDRAAYRNESEKRTVISTRLTLNNILASTWGVGFPRPQHLCENRYSGEGRENLRVPLQPRDLREWLAQLSARPGQPGDPSPPTRGLEHQAPDSLSRSPPESHTGEMIHEFNSYQRVDSSATEGKPRIAKVKTLSTIGCDGTACSGLPVAPASQNYPPGLSPAQVPSLMSLRCINGCPLSSSCRYCGDFLNSTEHGTITEHLGARRYEVDASRWPKDCSQSSSSHVSSPSSRSPSPSSTISFCEEFSPSPFPSAAIPKPGFPRVNMPVTVSSPSPGPHVSCRPPTALLDSSSTHSAHFTQNQPNTHTPLVTCSASPDTSKDTRVPYLPPQHRSSVSFGDVSPIQSGSCHESRYIPPSSSTEVPNYGSNRKSGAQPPDSAENSDALTAPVQSAKTSPRISRRDAFTHSSKARMVESNQGESDSGFETSESLSDSASVKETHNLDDPYQTPVSKHDSPAAAGLHNPGPAHETADHADGHPRTAGAKDSGTERTETADSFLAVPKGISGCKSQSDVDSDEDSVDQKILERCDTPVMPSLLSPVSYNPYPREYTPPSSPLSKRTGSQWRKPAVKKRGKISRLYTDADEQWNKKFTSAYKGLRMSIPDPSDQQLHWTKPPLSVLIIRKHLDSSVLLPFRDLVIWLVEEKNMLVYVEQKALLESHLLEDKDFEKVQHKLKPFKEDVDDLTDKVDFIICLGGDGTLLYVSSLFQGSVPPVMAFNMGSLGFLTPFQFSQDFKQEVSRVMQGSAPLLLRYRLKCVVMKHETGESSPNVPHVKNIQKEHKLLKTHKLVLNEVVLDRGPSSYLSNLDLYIEGRRVTTVQGDGLIISTPTGSTAYAVSAGASMIHPSVPCILLTPICPHSLSFRPIVVPAGVEIKLMLNPNSRGTAMVSFDGRDRQEIGQGDSLRITTAAYPVPSICGGDQIEDWFDGLAVCLNWNIRAQQRPLQRSPSLTSIDSIDSNTELNHSSNGYLSGSNNRPEIRTSEDKNSNNSGRTCSTGERRTFGKGEGKSSGHSRKPSYN